MTVFTQLQARCSSAESEAHRGPLAIELGFAVAAPIVFAPDVSIDVHRAGSAECLSDGDCQPSQNASHCAGITRVKTTAMSMRAMAKRVEVTGSIVGQCPRQVKRL